MTLPSDLKLSIWPDRKQEFEAKNPAGDDLVRWKYQTYMRDYFACVAGVDESVGQILKALDERGLTGNTVVMVSSDQGFYLGERGWFDKRFMYEESFRTPLIARWPGVIRPGSRNSDLVQNIDTAETFLDIAGAPIPPDMQGLSFVPLLKGQTPATWRTSLYYHYYEFPGTHSVRRHEGVATKRHKLIRFYGPEVPGGEEWEFYDLQTDPGERTNRIANPESAGTIRELKSELDRLRKQYQVPEGEHGPPVTRGKRTKEESAGD
jgi:arylsulfatase A-like enzyme